MKGYAARMARAHRAFLRGEIPIDPLEAMDAAHEGKWGRLPHEPGFGRPPEPVMVSTTPDLIPDWVLADAAAMLAGGYTLRKVASAILPATSCEDLPSCEELLAERLTPKSAL